MSHKYIVGKKLLRNVLAGRILGQLFLNTEKIEIHYIFHY
jgi:hypothetical protein